MSIKLLKQLALASTLALASISANASTYHYENTNVTPYAVDNDGDGIIRMNSYSTTWDDNSETLSINSSWTTPPSPANPVKKISFLISDGGSPWLTVDKVIPSDPATWIYTEQFLWYDVDLITSTVTVTNYFQWDDGLDLHGSKSVLLGTFDSNQDVEITPNSLSLTLNHTALNALTFGNLAYKGAGFSDDIGIWYYMYDENGNLVETLDIHHGTPSAVPVPAALFLFAPALAGFATMRRKLAKS